MAKKSNISKKSTSIIIKEPREYTWSSAFNWRQANKGQISNIFEFKIIFSNLYCVLKQLRMYPAAL
jgi:hypothetical protein